MAGNFKLFAGMANSQLAQTVAEELGISLGECQIERFPDGEIAVRLEESVREQKVFVLQPTSPTVDTHRLICLFK